MKKETEKPITIIINEMTWEMEGFGFNWKHPIGRAYQFNMDTRDKKMDIAVLEQPTRSKILVMLVLYGEPLSIKKLSKILDTDYYAVYKHVDILEKAALVVTNRPDKQNRRKGARVEISENVKLIPYEKHLKKLIRDKKWHIKDEEYNIKCLERDLQNHRKLGKQIKNNLKKKLDNRL